MTNIITFFALILLGHWLGALLVYLNHRFVFHGKLKRLPFFRYGAKIHAMHHKYAYEDIDPYIIVPLGINIVITFSLFLVGIFSVPLSVGLSSFWFLYIYRHWAIHNADFTSYFYRHHSYHHKSNIKSNYSGIYPVIDKVLGTYIDSDTERRG